MFSLRFRRHQAFPVYFSNHQASPWSSRTLSAHQVSPVTISASSRTVSALQALPVTISASPRPLGFLAFTISASSCITRLSGSRLLLQHRQTSISASRLPLLLRQLSVTLGDSQFPLQLQLSVSICGSRATSGSWLLLQHRQASLVPFSLWWLSAFTAGLGIVFQPFCSFSSDCFLLLVKYYSLFCLICKLGYLLSICILATAWLFWVILLLFFYYG